MFEILYRPLMFFRGLPAAECSKIAAMPVLVFFAGIQSIFPGFQFTDHPMLLLIPPAFSPRKQSGAAPNLQT
jgi:hypothetical protein